MVLRQVNQIKDMNILKSETFLLYFMRTEKLFDYLE